MWQDINIQHIDHHIDSVQYIGVQACDTCIVFCILSCTDTGGVPHKQNNFWQQCPLSIPSTCFILFPAPVTWGWKLRVCNQHLSPNTTSLVCSSFGMLSQRCFCWGKFMDCLNFLVNNCWLALLTECSLLVLSYSNTMNLSKR